MKKVILIFLLVLFNSCRNDNSLISESSANPISINDDVKPRISKQEAAKIGELHN